MDDSSYCIHVRPAVQDILHGMRGGAGTWFDSQECYSRVLRPFEDIKKLAAVHVL